MYHYMRLIVNIIEVIMMHYDYYVTSCNTHTHINKVY